MTTWSELLRDARRSVGLTRAELGRRADISAASVAAYELARRHPTRRTLYHLLDVLRVDRRCRNAVLVAAGYSTDAFEVGDRPRRELTFDEALQLVNRRRWPAFVVNEMLEVLGANRVGLEIMGVDRERLRRPIERNVLVLAMDATLARRALNWDQSVAGMIARFKAHFLGAERLEQPSPYFAAVLARVYEGDPLRAERFSQLWQETPAAYAFKSSWWYPVGWRLSCVGAMYFHVVVHAVNEGDGLDIHDWIPRDAESFRRVERLRASASAGGNGD